MLKLKFGNFLPLPPQIYSRKFHCLFFFHESIHPPSTELQKLCKMVSDVGNLDELEASLDQSAIKITPTLVTRTIDSCKTQAPNRRLLRFFSWSQRNLNSNLGDATFNHALRVFAEMHDLTAINILISDYRKHDYKMEIETFSCVAETLVKLGREDDAVGIFKKLEKFKCTKDRTSLNVIVHALCARGHARKAQGVVWHNKDKLPIEPCIYRSLLHGWCVHGNVKEARGIVNEMKSLGILPGLSSYNTLLMCVCKRNLKFNPSALISEATNLMMEMRSSGVSPTTISFNILLSCLCRTRRVKEAYRVLYSMRRMDCSPDLFSYYLVVRVLYLTGRFGKGNTVVDQMIEEGVVIPEVKFFHRLIGVLCGIEKVGHALKMFDRMKKCCVGDYGPVYDMLIRKLCMGGEFDKGRYLWAEAVKNGFVLCCSSDLLDPSKTQVYKLTKVVEKVNLEDFKRVTPVRIIKRKRVTRIRKKGLATKKKVYAT